MSDLGSVRIHLTDDELREFITIYKDEFGEELSLDAARAMASKLLKLYLLLAQNKPEPSGGPETPGKEKLSDPAASATQ